jgi:hypothetical protein
MNSDLELLDHEAHDNLDKETQEQVENTILEAGKKGTLIGAEAPIWRAHTVIHRDIYETVAYVIQKQLNHLAPSLGLLGFNLQYKRGATDTGKEPLGYFQIRAFADKPAE